MTESADSQLRPSGPSASRTRWKNALPLLAAGAVGIAFSLLAPGAVWRWLNPQTRLTEAALAEGALGQLVFLAISGLALFAGVLLAGILALRAAPARLRIARGAYYAIYAWIALYTFEVLDWSGWAMRRELPVAGNTLNEVALFFLRYDLLWPVWFLGLGAVFCHLLTWRSSVLLAYGLPTPTEAPGDRILENLRTGGRDPAYRRSVGRSVAAHLAVLIVIPWMLRMSGCVSDYEVPHGSGDPVVALVKTVKPQKKKKPQKLMLNPNSAILFNAPDLDDSQVSQQVEEITMKTYLADPSAVAGKLGAGGGKTGGWPEGTGKGAIRFVRMEYQGADWDDGMSVADQADENFLREFNKQTGFKVADKGESHPIRLLRKYSPGKAPPFVFMTGSGGISVPPGDIAILKAYLESGGMLFADCGSPDWDRSFRQFAAALFPGEPLRVIADDDPIFQAPYAFPNGAPPLWHHGGMKAMGIKSKGRWVVFYHPGDVNDAWKTGHSGLAPHLAAGAFQMGINIIHYSFTHYLNETKDLRK